MSDQSLRPSRRTLLSTGSTLLAGFGLGMALPADALASSSGSPDRPAAPGELAAYRPVEVSSTDYAPTPAEFAVDGVPAAGVRGTGWRAADGDPQWISVDLQALCEVESVHLTFEATSDDPPFVGSSGSNPRTDTTGQEILSSCAVDYVVETSRDHKSWTQIYSTTSGKGGAVEIAPAKPVTARWVRMTVHKRSNTNPLGLNGFQVYGTCRTERPHVTGWTDWGTHHRTPPALKVAADGTVPLESGWDLTMDDWADGDGAALSKPALDTSGWLPATVPGTVLTSLVDQGKLPEPVAGFGNLHVPEALSRHSWWYRRGFRLPKGVRTGAGRRLWLEFDGVNHKAEVWLNGSRVGEVTFPFARAAFDVTSLIGDGGSDSGSGSGGEQALAVKITPMPFPGSPADKGPAGSSWVDAGANMMNRNSPTYLASSGWDWMPAVRDRAAGIWNHVRLRSTGAAVLGDPRVDTRLPDLPDTGTAELTILVPVRNADPDDRRVTVSASFDGIRLSQTVTIPGGKTADVTFTPADHSQLRLKNPKLWWPNGYGDPALHDLTLTATVNGAQSDRRTTRFGIRQFGYESEVPLTFQSGSDAYAQKVTFTRRTARYVRIMCRTRATSWGSSMWALSVTDSSAPGTDLALHKDATSSSVDDPGNKPGNATDGDDGTRWSSSFEDDQWIRVDLGSSVSFDAVTITWEQAYARTFTVQVSDDGDNWTDAADVDNTAVPLPFRSSGSAALQTVDFTARTARHLRINCHDRATSWGSSMWSLSVLDSSAPDKDLALHQQATASSEDEDDHKAGNATDGDPNSRWSSVHEDDQWIAVDLGSSVTFDRVAILWETAYAKSFTIQVSDDGTTWTDVKSVDNSTVPLKISVNGVRVFCRGGNWGWDELLRRMPASRMDTAVRMHRDMNFTMIRNWVASSNREEFYASCDEHGLLVWNDFPNAWGMDPPDHKAFLDLAEDTVLRYRIHPSVVVWCGANEGNPPGPVDDGMRAAVRAQAPDVLYQNNSAGGIVSGGGPYSWVDPERYYSASTYGSGSFGFHTEIGMPVVPTAESMRNLVGDEPEWPIGGAWYYHDWSTKGNQAPQNYRAAIETRLGTAKDLDDFCRKAQFVNFESHRAMFEAWNANLWDDASGLMLWMSHPAWYSTVWQTYDYDFDVNGAYYGARKASEPVHVQVGPDGRVIAVNHTPHALTGATVSARRYDLAGHAHGPEQRGSVDVARSSTADAFTLDDQDGLPALHLLRLRLADAHGRLLSENTYWQYGKPEDMQALTALEPSRVSVDTSGTRTSGGRRELSARLRNRGSSVAAMVRVSLVDAKGHRVLPAQYSDNYLWLLPGESRTLTVSWPADAPATARLKVEPYNAR
ncbi:discoidin domain-containing protein [Streptomyces sp. VMFN-G11Ma]|uniref:discoidin domain-containing protein n=1 Tax=Streptomyces sp. VMFN-G11Ma TaxID=2135609 RepID=UPI000D3BA84D|nr:discoidin domain-containing protein [Streptomyces sp. VMFN-G11Ma]PTM96938.1 glycosyl hydrolase family 2 [Streptomyces sp. VMFN-G11Ma]